MFLSETSIRRPVFATMMMLALVTLGLFSFRKLSIDQWPEVSFPFIVVQTLYPGASPETVERDVTRRVEEAVNPISGVRTLTSTSQEGLSSVFIEFELDVKDELAQQDVRSKLEEIRDLLPEDIETPKVLRFDLADLPIISLALRSKARSIRELTQLAEEQMKKELEGIDGVGQVTVVGGETRVIAVEIDPERMASRAVTLDDLMPALASENREVPAGRLEFGGEEKLVRVAGRLDGPEDFGRVTIAMRGGVPIRVGDVARTIDDAEFARSAAMVDGVPAVGIDIRKVRGANTVEVAERIQGTVDELRARVPEGVELAIVRDDSRWIKDSVADVESTILIGALLTVLVVFVFLNSWRSTVITGLTLPVSVIAAFLAVHVFDYTLNTMTLMALSLAIGMLIDDAIVVRENIVRHVGAGEDHKTAARRGTDEIGLAVLATTLATLCVFIPVAFMGGIVGKFFKEFGVTVAAAVAVSLFVSFTLDPMLSSVWYDPVAEGHASHGPLGKLLKKFNHGFVGLGHRYRRLIGWALRHRWRTLGIAAAALIAALALFPLVGGEFFPKSDDEQLAILVEAPVGSTLEYTRDRVREVSALARRHPEVVYTYETVAGGWTAQVNEANVYLKLSPKNRRSMSQEEVARALRRDLAALPGVSTAVLPAGGFGGEERPLQIYVKGDDLDELRRISNEVLARVRKTPGAIEARSGMEEERPELRIDVDRDLASDLGLGVGVISRTLRPALSGEEVSVWEDAAGENHDVIVRLPKDARRSLAQLAALPLATQGVDPRTGAPRVVRLGHVARIEAATSPQQIDRRDMKRVVWVEANYEGRSMTAVSRDISRQTAAMAIPAGYSIQLGGETQDFAETVGYILESLFLAVIFIYLVLASQFGSFLQPLAIMLSLPLSLVGVLIALLLSRGTFNIMSMIGLILLMGLVTKNAILLVDFTNKRRARGVDRASALIDAGEIRLRPIVMTTLAMIFGMLPLALALGSGAEFRAPMARAVIGGLITSSLLTLIVVPVVYTFLDDLGSRFVRRVTREESR
ncbi:MAG TPA: efflux RND transporter permease subunit, partial [Candidatus Eisenbacteria bacterium]|nr:efflux RND transporter permease subunit [Candidatus Eisenbacteria bacterium]